MKTRGAERIEEREERAKRLPLAGDAEQVSVTVPLTDARGTMIVYCHCVVDVIGDNPIAVHLGDGWRRALAAVGVDAYDPDSEGWLATEAKRVLQRGGGR